MWQNDTQKTITTIRRRFVRRPIRKIVYCYARWQDCFEGIASYTTFVEGIPEDIPAIFPRDNCPGTLVLDDLMRNCSEDERILDLFTKVSHHCDVTCIYLTQNLFSWGKFIRSISLNAHYIVAFNQPCDSLGSWTLAQKAFGRTCSLRMGKFSRCHVTTIWLSHDGFTSVNAEHLTITQQHILPLSQSYPVAYINKKTLKTDKPLMVNFS